MIFKTMLYALIFKMKSWRIFYTILLNLQRSIPLELIDQFGLKSCQKKREVMNYKILNWISFFGRHCLFRIRDPFFSELDVLMLRVDHIQLHNGYNAIEWMNAIWLILNYESVLRLNIIKNLHLQALKTGMQCFQSCSFQ